MSDEQIGLAGISAMEEFYRSIDMPVNLKELGIAPTEEQIKALAAGCKKATGGGRGTAKMLYEDDFAAIYRSAL
jgi:alcohol dehydrogenase YqhD (iron-dependent ADH family)